ncbi:uncharacterized protein G2W53_039809 [Senna tora]|uniref:Uncharacterized protein n=1 Tax=Senna tora TaxID=362788 RepID=A0A834W3W3_9FABA|nr:uncharacterized protein G2W53_039809 [Senna tora]
MEQLRVLETSVVVQEELKGLNLAWDCKPATFLKPNSSATLLIIDRYQNQKSALGLSERKKCHTDWAMDAEDSSSPRRESYGNMFIIWR